MIKKNLFKTIKTLTTATIVALTITAGTAIGVSTQKASQATVKAYAQNYTDSTGYVLQLDGDTWHCYNSNGEIDSNYDGIIQNEFGWWKVSNGEVDFGFNGLASNQFGTWYISNGSVDFSVNGLTYDVNSDTWNYFIDGRLAEENNSVVEYNGGWWKLNKGKVDFNFTGLADNVYGWWYINNGSVDFSYSGLVNNEYGTWLIENGGVNFGCTSLVYNSETNEWVYINGGAVDYGNSSIVEFNGGWWKLANGKVDFSFNGIASNEIGEWVISNGTVDFGYNGDYNWNEKTYNIENGLVVGNNNNTDNGNDTDKKEGKLTFVDGQWVYLVDGQIDTSYNYIAENETGWWKVTNGVADINFTGIGEKEDGTKWLFSGGYWNSSDTEWDDLRGRSWYKYRCGLNTLYIGTVVVDGVAYDVDKGYVTPAKEDISQTYYARPITSSSGINTNEWFAKSKNTDGESNGGAADYIKLQDGIVYYMDDSSNFGMHHSFAVTGVYDKATNSFINNAEWWFVQANHSCKECATSF